MASIVPFPAATAPRRPPPPGQPSGSVIIFPGIRYERRETERTSEPARRQPRTEKPQH